MLTRIMPAWCKGEAMKLYSDRGPRRARQVGDVISLAFITGWVWLGVTIHRLITELATYGKQMEDAGASFRVAMTEVGDNLDGVPFIGSTVRVPFDSASGAGVRSRKQARVSRS